MKRIKLHPAIAAALAALAMMTSTAAFGQKEGIKVTGTVSDMDGVPLEDVAVINPLNDETVGTTDAFGSYSVIIPADGSLKFTCVGYKDGLAAVKGQLKIDVTMQKDVIKIQEVVVSAKAKRKAITPEPTDIEVKGNYFHLRTRIRVPRELFASDTRLVAQPSIVNVTTGERHNMKPLVFDGRQYAITQERMYDFRPEGDPLNGYATVKETRNNENDLVPYHDSIYVARPDDDYKADVKLSLEDYNRILLCDTFTIARGTINPLRFLDYDLDSKAFNDSAYIPRATMQLMDSKGEVNLTFVINKDVIDPNDPNNDRELARLRDELQAIENDSEASMHSLAVKGIASPDGRYNQNLTLARKRTATALESILAMLGAATRNAIATSSDAEVRGWEEVAKMLRGDTLEAEAKAIEDIIARHSDRDTQSRLIARLPFYRPLVTENYLPRLRKVEYDYEYTILRYMTDDEIIALYDKDYRKLTANEFYRLIYLIDDARREDCLRKALARFPKFLIAANELSRLLLREGRPDSSVLAPFVDDGAPQAIIYNQALCLLAERKVNDALGIIDLLDTDDNSSKLLKAVVLANTGYLEESFGVIAATSDINEVLMLLALKRNDEAWDKAMKLHGGSAREYYVKAVAANRTDNIGEALMYMQKAFELDPSLEDVARTDGDLIDLFPQDETLGDNQ